VEHTVLLIRLILSSVGVVESLPDLFELLEDVLVVEQCVRKLLPEHIALQIVPNALLHDWRTQDGFNVRSLARLLLQALHNKIFQCERILLGQSLVFAVANLYAKFNKTRFSPRGPQSC
jgi:hypothetical protein